MSKRAENLQNESVRVLLINQVFHPDLQATSQYLSRLAEALVLQGHEVTVLTARRDYDNPAKLYPAQETWNGVKIIRVWNTGSQRKGVGGRMLAYLSFLGSALLRGLFLPRHDVIMALTTPPLVSVLGAILALVSRARFVYWVMDMNPDQVVAMGWMKANSPMVFLLERALRWSLDRAERVIVPDIYMRDRLLAKGVDLEKIDVIPLWAQGDVEFDPAGREEFRRELGVLDKYVVMYSGNHSPCHPLDTLAEAARLLQDEPRIHFCFVGGGIDWNRLREKAEAEGWDNATFLGYQPEESLSALLSSADAQVVVMGDPFVGIVHPCKIYNFLAARRPFIYIGPERSHISDFIRDAGLDGVTAAFRHGQSVELADELRWRVEHYTSSETSPVWSASDRLAPWRESSALGKILKAMGD